VTIDLVVRTAELLSSNYSHAVALTISSVVLRRKNDLHEQSACQALLALVNVGRLLKTPPL
jgi:hypothetical protein